MLASTQALGALTFGDRYRALRLGAVNRPATTLLLSLLGVVSIGAIVLVNQSLRLAPASVVVPYQYTLIVWAILFGYLVLRRCSAAHTLVGAAIIVASGLFIFLREQQCARARAAAAS